ncbi:FAD-dependent oxidoreductase [Kribbella sp. NPDC059898]|uniref:FAD-dependent oxidoreductase n=1 Tax=Kribbella sp. NPDC059898 TaxID=3346995 RepID=UPI00365DA092
MTGVRTDDGRVFAADAVVIGIGAIPNAELAAQAGLDCADGIVVDEALRTHDPDVFVAGDVASAYHPFYGTHLRSEHWANALHGAPVAARSILGRPAAYDRLPYFYTDQYDIGMEFCGRIGPDGYDQLVTRGDVEGAVFQAFWLTDGRVVAGMHINLWDDGIAPIEELIRRAETADPARLTDPSIPLTADTVPR